MAPHRRFNPLTGEWVLVSEGRSSRPWLGERLAASTPSLPPYDPGCYLCPGNVRANGARNPSYTSTFAFTNDFSALGPETNSGPAPAHSLLRWEPERGECRVICFSPRHDLHLAQLPHAQVVAVVDCWAGEYARLAALPYIEAVTIFENRGAAMGASNPHPHGQIWAESTIPNELAKETACLRAFLQANGVCLLCEYAAAEIERAQRVVYADDFVTVVVPYWAIWPYETLVVPRHRATLADATPLERGALACALREIVGRYDALFGVPFPYSMGFHQAPNRQAHDAWHFHGHYYPPLLHSPELRKYMVGYEMLAQPQRDLTAEEAAARLRACTPIWV